MWALALEKSLNLHLVAVIALVFILSPTLSFLFSHDRWQLRDELLLFGIHHCILLSCHQGLLMMTLLATDLCDLCPGKKWPSRVRGQSLRTANAPAVLHVKPSVLAVKTLWIIFTTESHGISSYLLS